ncbi:AbrB/MazE/SpoVT family DNA-binding domain-containing protein [Tessaracoccus palaemonis]|uniref:AbrB/MazE/SpoVT family DNA-binding domain-containing protein n=1 Tax=Tessaracoccus palaemonis TaxID=2829499 RepID=A0ABX8SIY9_9ACTN|nr:AbrB/MazE/SpoVT family DNA-binding domain-containing protein [Tessaracoccus palaemonis]QXT62934.1 AbrB/MazE/SpoVT family DNA-binding domain-containing protein [Tessaracoccus palaemonis]
MPHPNDPDKRFYGAITVSDRGQIVIPAQARRDFSIEVGDKLLVFGDLRHGIALARADDVVARHPGAEAILGDGDPATEATSEDGEPGAD